MQLVHFPEKRQRVLSPVPPVVLEVTEERGDKEDGNTLKQDIHRRDSDANTCH